jgi:uncharacterized protein (DUF885 family)
MRRTLLALTFLLATTVHAATETEKLHQLFDEQWEWQLRESPESATFVGDRRYDDRVSDFSPAAFERRRARGREVLQRIEAIDRGKLSADDQLNYDLFRESMRDNVAGDAFPSELLAINQLFGIHSGPSELAQAIPRDTVKDHENFLTRLRAYPKIVDQVIALLRRGLEAGVTPPRMILGDVAKSMENQLVDDPAKSSIYTFAFTDFRSSIPAAEQQRLQKEAASVLASHVLPAIRKLHTFWTKEYYPKTRDTIAFTALPNGKAWYDYLLRQSTTTDLTADQIHELGLSEVKRIRAEMEAIKTKTGFQGTLAEFFTFLRTDPRFFYTTREDLLLGYRDISKRIDPELTRLFGRLPRIPYGVIPVPAYSEQSQTTAYYNSGSQEGNRPGYFYANLYDLKSRPKWEMEALTLHEAVPGHHLQISLAQELENVPKFRRFSYYNAFGEGWGLYAESLGSELGMYQDPYSKFGQLTYEMWRAVRLVVDTGMHAKGWTRDRAIQYFADNASKARHDIEVEIDRYIGMPGQATGYKIGELKFKELRAKAEKELGDRFDIRAFHDQLLGAGSLPLTIVEARMRDWVASRKAAASGAKATITLQTGGQ